MIITEIGRNVNLDHTNLSFRDASYENTAFNTRKRLTTNNPKTITMGHLNIILIPNKFDGIMDVVGKNLDVFLISETRGSPHVY